MILLYLTSWIEDEYGFKYRRSWKGYDFEILDELEEEGLIGSSRRAKSVAFSEDGIKMAKDIIYRYGLELHEAGKELMKTDDIGGHGLETIGNSILWQNTGMMA